MPEEARPSVAAVVLAAGASTRMGRNKLLLEVDGETLVVRAARIAAEAGLEPVLVVLGHEADRVAEALAGIACRTILNPGHASGQASSFRTGIAAVPAGAGAAIVILSDMPRVTASMLRALIARYRETGAPLVFSDYGGVSAPPILYDRSLFSEIAGGQEFGRDHVRRHRDRAVSVVWPADRLADLDRPEDIERLGEATSAPT
jgi:molybdenum cofactor cytidylyltransferase